MNRKDDEAKGICLFAVVTFAAVLSIPIMALLANL